MQHITKYTYTQKYVIIQYDILLHIAIYCNISLCTTIYHNMPQYTYYNILLLLYTKMCQQYTTIYYYLLLDTTRYNYYAPMYYDVLR